MDSNDGRTVSRRGIVGGAGIGLAAAAAAVPPAFAGGTSGEAAQPLVDPTTKYPRPPFKRQSQPWPGLASEMDPKPDHGETSYRGSGKIA